MGIFGIGGNGGLVALMTLQGVSNLFWRWRRLLANDCNDMGGRGRRGGIIGGGLGGSGVCGLGRGLLCRRW